MSATETIDVVVPDIGDFDAVPVIEILVSPGDAVAVDDPLLTLESDKATMDVPAPFAGVVKKLEVKVGDKVAQGTLLLRLEAAADGAADGETQTKASTVASQAAPDEASAPDSISAATRAEASDGAGDGAAGERTGAAAGGAADAAGSGGRAARGSGNGAGPVYASPSVRRLARERGLDLSLIEGSGRKGRITKEDVERAMASPGAAPAPGAEGRSAAIPGLELAPWPRVDFERFGPVERRQRSRIQKISAPNLARNWVMIPHVTQNDEADITELEAFRKQVNEEHAKEGVKLTMVGFLIAASVATLKEFPEFNSSLDGDDLVIKRYYNIGFAADTPGGLVVPVIRNADQKGILDIARELSDLSSRAREGKLGMADCRAARSPSRAWAGSGAPASPRSSTHPRWPSSAPLARPSSRSGTGASSPRG